MISLIPTAFVLIVATVDISWAKLVTIDNNAPRLDVHGNIIDAHDGTIQVHTDFWPQLFFSCLLLLAAHMRSPTHSHSISLSLSLSLSLVPHVPFRDLPLMVHTITTPCSMVYARSPAISAVTRLLIIVASNSITIYLYGSHPISPLALGSMREMPFPSRWDVWEHQIEVGRRRWWGRRRRRRKTNDGFHASSSPNFTFSSFLPQFQDRPAGTVFRPHAIYNPNTGEYVLWWNYVTPQGQ